MRVVVGSGNNRHVFEVPPRSDKVGRDMFADQIKSFLFRPALLAR